MSPPSSPQSLPPRVSSPTAIGSNPLSSMIRPSTGQPSGAGRLEKVLQENKKLRGEIAKLRKQLVAIESKLKKLGKKKGGNRRTKRKRHTKRRSRHTR